MEFVVLSFLVVVIVGGLVFHRNADTARIDALENRLSNEGTWTPDYAKYEHFDLRRAIDEEI